MVLPAGGCRLSRHAAERFVSLLEARGERVSVANDTVFYNYNRIVEPMAPAGHDAGLTDAQARALVNQLGGVLVRWGTGFADHDTGWYFVVSDGLPAVADNPSASARREIRKGLKNCRVERIDAEYMAKHGYRVYASAFSRYSGRVATETEAQFVDKMRQAARYPDIVHHWGVFVGDRLVGYSANYIFDDIEALSTELKLDPAYLRSYSSYALMQTMTEHYLASGTRSVNVGARSLAHDTAFQEYMITRFHFRKAFVRLRVEFSRPYDLGLRATRPLSGLIGRRDRRLGALYELHRLGDAGRVASEAAA